jgi:inorganic pyrophosphatase
MNSWHDINPGTKEKLNVIVEIPKLSRVKYELDKDTGLVKFDRVLYSPMHYPTNYGFVPQTLWEDGDPLDIFVFAHEPLLPGSLVESRPIGQLPMTDDGEDDVKILAVPIEDPRFAEIHNIEHVETHLLKEIKHFLEVYKGLQEKEVIVGEWENGEKAHESIERSFKLYKERYPS